MNIDQLNAAIKEKEQQQMDLANQLGDLRQQKAEMLCPFKVGDVGILNGYTFKGYKAKIIKIRAKYNDWCCDVVVLKANGDISKKLTDFRYEDHFQLID